MKLGILAGASALALLSASAAAQTNTGSITQSGTDQQAQINQIEADASTAEVIQSGAFSAGVVTQRGDLNRAKITQSAAAGGASAGVTQNGIDTTDAMFNDAEVEQTGASTATVRQAGTGNTARAKQSGAASFVDVDQTRSPLSSDPGNLTVVDQGADNASIESLQYGGGLKAGVSQSATADGASVVAEQVDKNHELVVRQFGANATALVVQSGDADVGNSATVTQYGEGADASVVQSGSRNDAEVLQTTGAARAALRQTGRLNRANAQQFAVAEADIVQNGVGNTATTTQFAADTAATITQTGDGHFAFTRQEGKVADAQATVTQSGRVHVAVVSQYGDAGDSSATIDQIGTGNASYATQYGAAGSTATIAAAGDHGVARLNQAGGGGHAATVRQGENGEFNVANIHQGVSPIGGSDPTSTGNEATVAQNGERNLATVTQTGSLNEASVVQNGNDAVATITQSGSGGMAIITQ